MEDQCFWLFYGGSMRSIIALTILLGTGMQCVATIPTTEELEKSVHSAFHPEGPSGAAQHNDPSLGNTDNIVEGSFGQF